MNIATGLISFVIIWWLALFTVLPWGIQRNESPAVGEDNGAPMRDRIGLKMLITTGIALVIWGALFAAIQMDIFSFRDIAGSYRR